MSINLFPTLLDVAIVCAVYLNSIQPISGETDVMIKLSAGAWDFTWRRRKINSPKTTKRKAVSLLQRDNLAGLDAFPKLVELARKSVS